MKQCQSRYIEIQKEEDRVEMELKKNQETDIEVLVNQGRIEIRTKMEPD